MYFNSGRSHTYEYGLPVNFTRMSSFCAGRVFIQPVQSKLPVNSTNIIYKNCGAYLTSELTNHKISSNAHYFLTVPTNN